MKQIPPSTLRAHLAQGQAANRHPDTAHPDADLLTAFAENTLLDRERTDVLAHLATCPDCRAIVQTAATAEAELESEALLEPVAASPRLEPVPQPVVARAAVPAMASTPGPQPPPRRAWFPVLALAASLLVMAGSTVFFYRALHTSPASTQTAASAPASQLHAAPPLALAPEMSATPSDAIRKPAHTTVRVHTPVAPPVLQTEEARIGAAAPSPPAPVAGTSSSGNFGALSFQKAQNEPSPEQALLHAQQAQMQAALRGSRTTVQSEMAKAAPRSPTPPSTTESVQVQTNDAVARPLETTHPVAGFASALNAAHPRFRITDEGRIERSVQASIWMPVAIASDIHFRVISVSGSEVWAGGDQLRLFHSTDNGVTWTEVHLPAGADRTHAIVHIRIDDAQHLSVEDDSGGSWTTRDAGAAWQ